MKRILQTMLLLLITAGAFAQDRAITGTVTDKTANTPMPGVNVSIKGTSTGTITDGNGQFKLNAPASATTIIFSFIGFTSQK